MGADVVGRAHRAVDPGDGVGEDRRAGATGADGAAVERHRRGVERRRLGELDEHPGVLGRPQVHRERAAGGDQAVGDGAVVDADADRAPAPSTPG